ncbi:MAG: adenylate/guanylate cyclase domain-containing protein [Pseudomonadota bacterium]
MKKARRFTLLFSALFFLFAMLEMTWLHALQPLENRLSDFFVRKHAQTLAPDPDIVIINVDDASLEKMENVAGNWPWPRAVFAEMITAIDKQQPKAIVFDKLFVERDVYRPESDALFNQALEGKKNIYFPLVRQPATQDKAGAALAKVAGQLGILRTEHAIPDAHAALMPPMAIEPKYWRVGTVNFLNDADGVGRGYDVYTDAYGWLIPSLPARLATDLGYFVPRQANIILAWRGGNNPYRRISFGDLYADQERQKPLRDPYELRDKIVIIGADASAMHDIRVTPIDSLFPGLDILATAIDNLKNRRWMQALPTWVSPMFFLLLLSLLCTQFYRHIQALKIGVTLLLLTFMSLAASYLALQYLILLHFLTALLLAWLYYFSFALREYLRERNSRQHAVQMFSRFVNPHVVKELVASGGLSRSGESREISVLFSDIRDFTKLAEKRTPQEIVTLLNRYFSLQVEVIFRHGGSLDKFIGDCIMAFWGAPLDDPEHARHATEAALEMVEVLHKFKLEIGAQGDEFDVGIGIHSGAAVVGLIGSEQRREYTAIGDTVNLASRVEGLTKGVSRILVSRETMLLCKEALDFAPFGSYKVKGREQEVELFAPKRREK